MIERLKRYLARLGQKIIISDGSHPSGLPLFVVENNDWHEMSLNGESLLLCVCKNFWGDTSRRVQALLSSLGHHLLVPETSSFRPRKILFVSRKTVAGFIVLRATVPFLSFLS